MFLNNMNARTDIDTFFGRVCDWNFRIFNPHRIFQIHPLDTAKQGSELR